MAVSELGLQQILLQGFQRAQEGGEIRQIQLASGKKFQTYGEYGADTLRLVSSEGVFARATAYENAAKIAATRLEIQASNITSIGETVEGLRQNFVRTMATGGAELILPELEAAAQRILTALNTQVGGVYIFGGGDGTVPPVDARSLSDLAGAGSIDALFQEGDRLRLAIEEGVNIDGGPRASDIARDLLIELQDLANAQATLGPFQGELTNAQRLFIMDKLTELAGAVDRLNQELGLNAGAQGQADEAVRNNRQRRDYAEIIVSEIEDVDIAEVIARLNQDQIAIQASAQALSQASQLSLLNFI